MHTSSPAIMSLDGGKNHVGEVEESDGDVLKQETQDLVGLLSSPDPKQRHDTAPAIKMEVHDIKEEVKEENSVKIESNNPANVGKLPNGDANLELDKGVSTPGDIKTQEKNKQEQNGGPHTPGMCDGQGPPNMSNMHRNNMVSGMCMSPGNPGGMLPHMGPQMPQGQPMGPGMLGMPSHPSQGGMMSSMGPMNSGMGPGPMGPNGGGLMPHSQHQQVSSDGQLVQQQSEVFVFTTQLANEAAQAVQSGQYKNILSYHMDQPNTKALLQKNPKMRASAAMYNMHNMRSKMMGGQMSGMGGPMGPYGPGPGGPNNSSSVAQWVQQQNLNLQEQGLGGMNDRDPRMMMGPNSNFSQMMMDDGMFDPDFGGPMNNVNIMQNKVPNENLTPEQLQRRQEQLSNLRKIQQMLFPEIRSQQGYPPLGPGQGPGGPGPGGQGMMPGDMDMYHPSMMGKRGMMSQPGMMNSPHGMMDSRPDMMSQEQFMMSQGMSQFGPGPHPQSMQNMSPAQREWIRLQQEHMAEKRSQQQPRGPMGSNGPGPQMGPGPPPPSYYSSIAQKQRHGSVGMGSPTSPNMNGPMGSPSMPPDPNDQMMYGIGQRKGSFSGMDHMGPMGPVMGPVMDPIMPQGSPMNHSMPGHMGNMPSSHPGPMKGPQVSIQRAGNPEQFIPEMPAAVPNSSASKPPPSYAQSTKRKRDDMEELCKNLQPTPSPQHISYLNQFDGQELTITKQINTAYRDTNPSESQSNHYTQNNQMVNSPLHAPGSNKGPMSNSSQTSSGQLASPGPVSVPQNSGQGPGPGQMSGANMRLSHYDPQQQAPQNSGSISNSPTTPTGKSSLSNNITSASLANLAKGVENLSHQMQQHMMQGGPFHSIQMQGQQQQQQQQQQQLSQGGQGQVTPQTTQQGNQSSQSTPNPSQASHSAPSVNNTFVNNNVNINQVNIQSVNHQGGGAGNNYNPNNSCASSMQVQQTNMEQSMNVQSGGVASMTQAGSMSQASMTQSSMNTSNPGMMMNGNKMLQGGPMNMKDVNYGGMGPPSGMHKQMSPFAQSQNPQQVPTLGRPMSPGYPASSMGNANVTVQQKAPNTIQYLPANQSNMLPENKTMSKPDLDFMTQFTNSVGNMDNKVPSSKMQYFPGGGGPNGQGGSMYGGPPGSMGPGSGMDGRMGPSMGMGPGGPQDPRFGGPSMSDPRMDPRMGPSMVGDPRMGPSMGGDPRMGPSMGGDPRMGPMGPSGDPRMVGRPDGRMGTDMGMGCDPRMGPGGMGPMSDPRMGPGSDPRMGPGSDPRMGPGSDPRMGPGSGSMMGMGPGSGPMGPMRPGSRGSPFSGPIGPAVQQSMMMRRASPDLPMGNNYSHEQMHAMNMNSSLGGPMSALSSMTGNPMTSMSNMSNSLMNDTMSMGPMVSGPSSMGSSMPYNSPPYSGGPMGSPMMSSGPSGMQGPRMQGPGMGQMSQMSRSGPFPRQPSPGMRMSGPQMGPGGPLSPGAPGYSSQQYQQFQQQLYAQGRQRQMSSPMDGMMGQPGGYGPMGPGMMPNMHGGM